MKSPHFVFIVTIPETGTVIRDAILPRLNRVAMKDENRNLVFAEDEYEYFHEGKYQPCILTIEGLETAEPIKE